jgi:hypothetical protein
MKKLTMLLLILIFLSFNIIRATPVFAVNVFKEGIYKAADFNFSPNDVYNVQNVSPNSSVYVLLFDENQLGIQSIRLDPQSSKYNLLPLKPDYRIVIVGNGEVFIA